MADTKEVVTTLRAWLHEGVEPAETSNVRWMMNLGALLQRLLELWGSKA